MLKIQNGHSNPIHVVDENDDDDDYDGDYHNDNDA